MIVRFGPRSHNCVETHHHITLLANQLTGHITHGAVETAEQSAAQRSSGNGFSHFFTVTGYEGLSTLSLGRNCRHRPHLRQKTEERLNNRGQCSEDPVLVFAPGMICIWWIHYYEGCWYPLFPRQGPQTPWSCRWQLDLR